MLYGARRPLTVGEERALSPGLVRALRAQGSRPTIVARPALGARFARLWRRSAPILAWKDRIYWPGALADFAAQHRLVAVLQHELQHVLEYRTGDLGPLRYALRPHNWRYAYQPTAKARWQAFGAEQRLHRRGPVAHRARPDGRRGAPGVVPPDRPLGLEQQNAPQPEPRGVAVRSFRSDLERAQGRQAAHAGALAVLFLQRADAEVPARADGPGGDVEVVAGAV